MKTLLMFLILSVSCIFAQQSYYRVFYAAGDTVSTELNVQEDMKPVVIDFPSGFTTCDVTFLMYTDRPTKTFNTVKYNGEVIMLEDINASETIVLEPSKFLGFSTKWKLEFSTAQLSSGYIIIGFVKW